jgi:hypothetical protein
MRPAATVPIALLVPMSVAAVRVPPHRRRPPGRPGSASATDHRRRDQERRALIAALLATIVVAVFGGAPSSASAATADDDEVTPLVITTLNVPYVFERFTVKGKVTDAGFVAEPAPRPHEDELPLWDDVVDFPG